MKVSYTITKDDIAWFTEYLYWDAAGKKSFRRWAWVIGLLPAAVIIFAIADKVHANYENSKSVLIAIFGMLAIVFSFLSPYYYKWRFRRMGRTLYKKSPDLHGLHEVELKPDNVYMTTSKGLGKRAWGGFTRLVQTNHLVLLFINETSAHIIPKRAFKDDAEEAKFVEMFQKYLEPKP